MLSWYIAKSKYILKMIQINAKLDEVLNHILDMNWLYHFNSNWKFWLVWFQNKYLNKFFHSNKHKCVEKKHFVEIFLSFKRWQELCWRPMYRNPFHMFMKMLDEIKEKLLSKYTKIYPPKNTFSCLKQPPLVCFHPTLSKSLHH
jgi:hypothetical protein